VERANRTYEEKRQKFLDSCRIHGKLFCEHLFLQAHFYSENCTVFDAYNIEPFVLMRGRAPATSTAGRALSPVQMETMRRRCAKAQVDAARRVFLRLAPKCAKAIETFKVGDVVLVAATDSQMKKKEVVGGRWGCVARIHMINKASASFYILRFHEQGHLSKERPGTLSNRFYFALRLKKAPAAIVALADAADERADNVGAGPTTSAFYEVTHLRFCSFTRY
jgi:hypothetical protein